MWALRGFNMCQCFGFEAEVLENPEQALEDPKQALEDPGQEEVRKCAEYLKCPKTFWFPTLLVECCAVP